MIINGAMQIAQRGTSSTGITNGNNGYHTVDRFRFVEGGSPTFELTLSQSTEAPTGFSNSFKFDVTTAQSSLAAGDYMSCDTIIEAQNLQHLSYGTSSAKSITLSFWVRSNLTGTYNVWFYQDDDSREATKTYTIDTADTWEHKTITISGDQTGVIDNDNGRGFFIRWHLASGTTYTGGTANKDWGSLVNADRAAGLNVNMASSTSNEWYLTGVQLEVGEQATPFEHRSYGDELHQCRRYFQPFRSYAEYSIGTTGSVGGPATSFVPAMRVAPTFNITSSAGASSSLNSMATTSGGISGAGVHQYYMNFTISSSGYMYITRSGTADAEL
jgi:hypothetical protein